MSSPRQILEEYLDLMGRAIMADDFDTYADQISLPFVLVTEVTTLVIQNVAELEHGFDAFVEMMQSQDVTEFRRVVESAVVSDDGLVSGRYVTHILRDGQPIVPPFGSRIGLRFEDDRWRAVSIANSLTNARWPIILPEAGSGTNQNQED
jgi:hypothetical protein